MGRIQACLGVEDTGLVLGCGEYRPSIRVCRIQTQYQGVEDTGLVLGCVRYRPSMVGDTGLVGWGDTDLVLECGVYRPSRMGGYRPSIRVWRIQAQQYGGGYRPSIRACRIQAQLDGGKFLCTPLVTIQRKDSSEQELIVTKYPKSWHFQNVQVCLFCAFNNTGYIIKTFLDFKNSKYLRK